MTFIRKNLKENARKWEQLEEEFNLGFINEQGEDEDEEVDEPEADEEELGDEEDDVEDKDIDDEGGTGDEYEEHTDALYRRVQGLLNNDIFNHAAIVERLWGTRDGTARSLFRKKVEKETTEDGYEYSFDRQELSDILAILGRAGSEAVSAYQKGRMKKRTPVSEK